MFLITGGLGFIGTNFIKKYYGHFPIINIDKFSKVSNELFARASKKYSYIYIEDDLKNSRKILDILDKYKPKRIIHFAAESHVDRSISNPNSFIENNVSSTTKLLIAFNEYYKNSSEIEKKKIKFLYVSTDEVYGELKKLEPSFTEKNLLQPSSPYSASKAASEMIALSYIKTFELPILITRCSNNYGKYQYTEKLIPKIIYCLFHNKKIPVYGDGRNIRDWLHVDDHIDAIMFLLRGKKRNGIYNIGSNNELSNKDLIKKIISIMNSFSDKNNQLEFNKSIEFVKDRLGHDKRYSINPSKIFLTGWRPKKNFDKEMLKTVKWYLKYYENRK